ncbi:MAG: hypothetical protein KIC46_02555 [Clostridiales bacterium]|nr:hypothetical protein [Clostridiales bacterium]
MPNDRKRLLSLKRAGSIQKCIILDGLLYNTGAEQSRSACPVNFTKEIRAKRIFVEKAERRRFAVEYSLFCPKGWNFETFYYQGLINMSS